MDNIIAFLEKHGPGLSSKCTAYMIKHEGISRDAARQRLTRMPAKISKLGGKHLPKREAFIYLQSQYNSPEYFDALKNAYIETQSAPGKIIQALKERNGIINEELLPVASGLPISQCKNQLSYELCKNVLIELQLISKIESPDGNVYITESSDARRIHYDNVTLAENIVLEYLKKQLGHLSIVSPDATKVRDLGNHNIPSFGPFKFDFSGPSYLSCFSDFTKTTARNGFIVGDIFMHKAITKNVVDLFLNKCQILSSQGRKRSFIGFIIGDFFAPDGFKKLRENGIIPLTTDKILGKDLADELKQLISTLENAAAAIVNNPEQVFSLMSKISKIEGAVFNIRGALFELIIGRLFNHSGYNIDIRKIIKDENEKTAEIDIKAINRQECVCIECKGMAPGNLVNANIIQDWHERTLPRINSWLKRQESISSSRFEFIVSSGYTKDALELIHNIEHTYHKRPIKFYDGKEVLLRLKNWNETQLINIFREQFK